MLFASARQVAVTRRRIGSSGCCGGKVEAGARGRARLASREAEGIGATAPSGRWRLREFEPAVPVRFSRDRLKIPNDLSARF